MEDLRGVEDLGCVGGVGDDIGAGGADGIEVWEVEVVQLAGSC